MAALPQRCGGRGGGAEWSGCDCTCMQGEDASGALGGRGHGHAAGVVSPPPQVGEVKGTCGHLMTDVLPVEGTP